MSIDQTYRYCFRLEPDYPKQADSFNDILPFFYYQQDREFFSKCVYFQSYYTFEIIAGGDGFPYICIMINQRIFSLEIPFAQAKRMLHHITRQKCRIPYLAPLAFEGLAAAKIDKPALLNQADIIRLSAHTPDVFAVYCLPGEEKTAMIHTIARTLLQENKFAGEFQGFASVHEYLDTVERDKKNGDGLLEKILHETENIKYFIHTLKDARMLLEKLMQESIAYISPQRLREWMDLINSLQNNHSDMPPSIKRLLKNVYALPVNEVMFEDNGERVLIEILARLERLSSDRLFVPFRNRLSSLYKDFDNSPRWYGQLQRFQKELLKALHPVNDIISEEKKDQICVFLALVHRDVKEWKKRKYNDNRQVLSDFYEELSNDKLACENYLHPIYTKHLLTIAGVCLVDMDFVQDEAILVDAWINARQIVLFSSKMDGMFHLLYKGAKQLEKKDGVGRTAFLTQYNRHPAITEFILQSFYPDYAFSATETVPAVQPANDFSPFTWMEWEGNDSVVIEHLAYSLERYARIGVVVAGKKDDLLPYGIQRFLRQNEKQVEIVAPSDNEATYDVVYLWYPENYARQDLCHVFSKGVYSIVAIGTKMNITAHSLLQDFYFRCIGEDVYGKIIG